MNSLPHLGVILTGLILCGAALGQTTPADVEQSFVEVQTRGPVHEAFAQPYDVAVQIDAVIQQKPPNPIAEEPPDLKPEGANMTWIPGYWTWDADSNSFMWISGVYRDAPAGRVYVAGYWEQTTDGGWRWVHGFWAPADQAELPYVPPPPASLDTGPTLPPPGDDYTYVPGCWVYSSARYAWRPGYYVQCRPDMVWIPPCYVWTPGGCLYVSGYWDYPLERRGCLFAPVVFSGSLWLTPGWCWRPSHVITPLALLDALFIDGRAGHYRYGDWYSRQYANRGIQPWHHVGTKGFDPLYAHYRAVNRNNAVWQASLATQYNDRLTGKASRPPRTLAQQAATVQQTNNAKLRVATPLAQVAQVAAGSGLKLTQATGPQQQQTRLAAQQMLQASQTRRSTEANLALQKSTKSTTTAALKVTQPPQVHHETKLPPSVKVDPKMPAAVKTPTHDAASVHAGKVPQTETKQAPAQLKVDSAAAVQPQHKTVQSLPKVEHAANVAPIKTVTPNHVPPLKAMNPAPQIRTVQQLPKVEHTANVAPIKTITPNHAAPLKAMTPAPQIKTAQALPQVQHNNHVAPVKTMTAATHTVRTPPPPQVHARPAQPAAPAHSGGSRANNAQHKSK
jgi:hypothetical protein